MYRKHCTKEKINGNLKVYIIIVKTMHMHASKLNNQTRLVKFQSCICSV